MSHEVMTPLRREKTWMSPGIFPHILYAAVV